MPLVVKSPAGRTLGPDVERLVFDLASRGPTLAREAGMHPTDLRALAVVLRAERDECPVGPARLAQELGLTTAAVTSVVDRLAALGLVRREPSATDRRRVQIAPAAAAASSTLGGLGHVVAAIADRVGSYTPADQAVVARFLTDVLAITEQADDA